ASELPALSFVRGNGDGTFATARSFHTNASAPARYPGMSASGGVIADVNHDQKPDVVVIQKHPDAYPYDLGVMLNDGSGALAAPILSATDHQEWTGSPVFTVGDVDNDGNLDAVVVSNLGYVPRGSVYRGNGAGGFGAPFPVSAAV